jgi:hypothetical protein
MPLYTDSHELFVEEQDEGGEGVNDASLGGDASGTTNMTTARRPSDAAEENVVRTPPPSPLRRTFLTQQPRISSGGGDSIKSPLTTSPKKIIFSPKQRIVQEALLMQGHTVESLRNQFHQQHAQRQLDTSVRVIPTHQDSSIPSKTTKLSFRRMAFGPKQSFRNDHHSYNTKATNINASSFSQSNYAVSLASSLTSSVTTTRRYKVGDHVLVYIPPDPQPAASSPVSLQPLVHYVNRHGFRPDDSRDLMDDDDSPHNDPKYQGTGGPYQYVLATVQQIHFEEIHPYYTVLRHDVDLPQRADLAALEPLVSPAAGEAARNAAARTARLLSIHRVTLTAAGHVRRLADSSSSASFVLPHMVPGAGGGMEAPSAWRRPRRSHRWDGWWRCWMAAERLGQDVLQLVRGQANLCLYGREPYLLRMRCTMVNFVVVCSAWYMFMDQVRLGFLPPSADGAVAVLSCVVWAVLILELACEVFIRPDGYQALLFSDKAYAPTTVRYLHSVHLVIELFSLLLYISEFACIFTGESCSQRLPLTFYNAALLGVIGPSFREVFLGHGYIALVRLRVFGMVRHWRNMWITRTFIDMTWRTQPESIVSNIIPPSVHHSSMLQSPRGDRTIDSFTKDSLRKKGATATTLTNASNIGTALMAINSYRALAIVCLVIGLFPMLFSLTTLLVNPLADQMTRQLQAVNLVAADTSNATCAFLKRSIEAWLIAVGTHGGSDDSYLLTLDLRPIRCGNIGVNAFTNAALCRTWNDTAPDICDQWSTFEYGDTNAEIANASGIREGSIEVLEQNMTANLTWISPDDGSVAVVESTEFSVLTRFNHSMSIQAA